MLLVLGEHMAATRGVRVVGAAIGGVVVALACVGTSWRSDAATLTGGQRVVAGGSTRVVASGIGGVVAVAGVVMHSDVTAIHGGRGLQLVVLLLLPEVVVPMLVVVGVLHVGLLQLLVLVFGRLLLHLLVGIEMLIVGGLVALLFVL
jgi:hypothetical protein